MYLLSVPLCPYCLFLYSFIGTAVYVILHTYFLHLFSILPHLANASVKSVRICVYISHVTLSVTSTCVCTCLYLYFIFYCSTHTKCNHYQSAYLQVLVRQAPTHNGQVMIILLLQLGVLCTSLDPRSEITFILLNQTIAK